MKLSNKGTAVTKNERVLLYILGVGAIFALCYLFIITPASKKNKPVTDEIKKVDVQLKEVENINNEIQSKERELSRLQEDYEKASASLPKTDKYPQIFKDVEAMAVSSGLTSFEGKFDEPEVVKTAKKGKASSEDKSNESSNLTGLQSMKMQFTVNNDIEKALTFVNKLENDKRLADIRQVKQSGDYITITVYYYSSGGTDTDKEEYDFN